MEEIGDGIRRVTLPLPTRPGHVHSYALPGDDGWTIVDTGLGLPDARDRWAAELDELPGRVGRIVVTHFHPDHVGAAADVAELTGAQVAQGRLDYEQCELVWGGEGWADVLVAWFRRHGVPDDITRELIEQGSLWRPFIRYQPDPELLDPGDRVDGWEAIAAPGHADGQLMLLREGVLVAADHVLATISPTVGLWPRSRPDPLGDYLGALETTIALDARVALPGHGDPIDDPSGRARELIEHHRVRLAATQDALGGEPRTAYDVSIPLFGDDLKPSARRFAVAETLSHLERLVLEGEARRIEADRGVAYTSAE
jgi:glyoxylase-like metal-dependent hydrolase (beta-lactamase superfamily II)